MGIWQRTQAERPEIIHHHDIAGAEMNTVLILREPDEQAQAQAKKRKWGVVIAEGSLAEIPFDRALIVTPGVTIPWDLVNHGFRFLQRWDAAAPLWRYGVTAADVGTSAERERTKKVTLDLRVLLYSHELLFVRNSPDGRTLLTVWEQEMVGGGDPRLAFLRAVYRVRPLFLTLPRTWLAELRHQSPPQSVRHRGRSSRHRRRSSRRRNPAVKMVRVEIAPGRYVRCKPGEEEETRKRWDKVLSRGHRSKRKRR